MASQVSVLMVAASWARMTTGVVAGSAPFTSRSTTLSAVDVYKRQVGAYDGDEVSPLQVEVHLV